MASSVAQRADGPARQGGEPALCGKSPAPCGESPAREAAPTRGDLPERGEGRGLFITFEGGDGAGKSTQIRFLARFLEERGREVLRLREPGGTAVGEALRRVVLDPAHGAMSDRAELLIYEAARAQIVDEVIRPALERGAVVLCDRFFDSTVAYQGFGRGLDADFVEAANRFACNGVAPDLTVLLVASAEATRERLGHRGEGDRLERAGEDFHRRVAEGFQAIAAAHPDRVAVVVSQTRRADTFRAVLGALAPVLPGAADALDGDDGALEALVDAVMVEKRREKAAAQGAGQRDFRDKGRGGKGGRKGRSRGPRGAAKGPKGPSGKGSAKDPKGSGKGPKGSSGKEARRG